MLSIAPDHRNAGSATCDWLVTKSWKEAGRGPCFTTDKQKEAAFEAAVAAASLAIRQGLDVQVGVPGHDAGNETAPGAQDKD